SGGLSSFREIDESSHPFPQLVTDGPQLGDLADRGLEIAEPLERVPPHLGEPGAAQLQDRVEKRSPLQAERTRACAQDAQEDETAKPFEIAPERGSTSAELKFCFLFFILLGLLDGMIEERVADKVVIGFVVLAQKHNG